MNPERTQLTAPDRIYLGYTSFWYETSEEGMHDIEYVKLKYAIDVIRRIPAKAGGAGAFKASVIAALEAAANSVDSEKEETPCG